MIMNTYWAWAKNSFFGASGIAKEVAITGMLWIGYTMHVWTSGSPGFKEAVANRLPFEGNFILWAVIVASALNLVTASVKSALPAFLAITMAVALYANGEITAAYVAFIIALVALATHAIAFAVSPANLIHRI
jgi:hypothetical protein